MAVAIAQSITAKNSTTPVNFASWTVNPNELLLVCVTMRTTSITPAVSGNGVTWVNFIDVTGGQNRFVVFRAMPTSASTGAISVIVTGNSKPIVCIAARLTGCNTGNNGANAIDVTGTGNLNNSDMLKAITTISDGAQVVAFGTYRTRLFTVPSGQTGLIVDEIQGSSGDTIASSWWQKNTATSPPASVTMGGIGDLSGSVEWIMAALSIKGPNVKSFLGTLTSTGSNSSRRVGKPTLGSAVFFGSAVNPIIGKVAAGAMNLSSTLQRSWLIALAGLITFSGQLLVKSKGAVNLTATLLMSGTIPAKPIFKNLAGLWRAQGSVFKFFMRITPLTGTLTMSGMKRSFLVGFDTFQQVVASKTRQILRREKP